MLVFWASDQSFWSVSIDHWHKKQHKSWVRSSSAIAVLHISSAEWYPPDLLYLTKWLSKSLNFQPWARFAFNLCHSSTLRFFFFFFAFPLVSSGLFSSLPPLWSTLCSIFFLFDDFTFSVEHLLVKFKVIMCKSGVQVCWEHCIFLFELNGTYRGSQETWMQAQKGETNGEGRCGFLSFKLHAVCFLTRPEVQGINTLFKTQTRKLYTLFKTGIPENHTLSSGTSPYSKYRGVPPCPSDLTSSTSKTGSKHSSRFG